MKRLFFVVIVIVTALMVASIFLPSVGARLWDAHKRYEKMVARYNMAQGMGALAEDQLAKVQQSYMSLTKNLPTAENFTAFLNMVLNEGRSQGLQFTRVQQETSVLNAGINDIPVQLTFSGSYTQFLNFLKTLQQKNYLVIMDEVNMTRQHPPVTTVLNQEIAPDRLTFTVTAHFYGLP